MEKVKREIIIDNNNISDSEIQAIIQKCISSCNNNKTLFYCISIPNLSKTLKEKFLIYTYRNLAFEGSNISFDNETEKEMEEIKKEWKNTKLEISDSLQRILNALYAKKAESMYDIYTGSLPKYFTKPEDYEEFYNLFPNYIDMETYKSIGIGRPHIFNSIQLFNNYYRNKRGRTETSDPIIEISDKDDLNLIEIPQFLDTIVIHIEDINNIPIEKLELLSKKINLKIYYKAEDELDNNEFGYGKKKRYYYTFDELKQIEGKVNEIIKDINPEESQLKKFLIAYERLGKQIDYDYDEDEEPNSRNDAHNLKGALLEGKCVCEGYALSLKYILQHLNIKCKCIDSYKHVWNQVEIDGIWYNCDLTYDASAIKENRQPEYCLKSDREFINHSTKCKWKEECNESYSWENQANRLIAGNFDSESLKRELQYLCEREGNPSFQSELEIFKKAYKSLGLNFEEDYKIAKYRFELDNIWSECGEMPSHKEKEMREKAEELGLDFDTENTKANKRRLIRMKLWQAMFFSNEKETSKLKTKCMDLGLNWDYELYKNDTTKKPIAIYIEDGIKSMAKYISEEDVNRVKSELLRQGKSISTSKDINSKETR